MKYKKIIALMLTAAMVLIMAACSSESNETTVAAAGGETTAAAASEDSGNEIVSEGKAAAKTPSSNLKFKAGGKDIQINMDTSEFLDALGDPDSYFEAESCAFQGLDKVYTFKDFVIRTYPDGDIDRVSSIELRDDIVTTAEGAYIGMTEDDIKSLYGSFTIEGDASTALTVKDGDTKLSFIFEDGSINSITYTAAE